ncbi:hypothetical protein JCM9279_000756 [Rhodotorula babjevae]
MSRGKRSRAHREKRAAELAALQASQPAPEPRPSGAARFTPSSNYLAHQHPPPPPVAQPYPAYPPQHHPYPPQHPYDHPLAGSQPLASSSASHFDHRPPGYGPPPAAYGYPPPREPVAYYPAAPPYGGPGPSRSTWPPQAPHHYPERADYGPPPPTMPPTAYPPSHSPPPTHYSPESQQAYARPPQPPLADPYRQATHLYDFPSSPAAVASPPRPAPPAPSNPASRASARPRPPPPPPPAPLVTAAPSASSPDQARAPFSMPAPTVKSPASPAPPSREPSPAAGSAPPADVTPSRAPPTPSPPPAASASHASPSPPPPPPAAQAPSPPAPAPCAAAPVSPEPLSAIPAALRTTAMSTPISAAHDFVAFPPPSSAIKPERDDSREMLVGSSDPAAPSSSSSEDEAESSNEPHDGSDSEDDARIATALVGPRSSRRVGAPLFRAHSVSSSDDDSEDEDRNPQAHELQPDDDADDSDAIVDLEAEIQEQVDDDDDDDPALNDASLAFDLGSASEGEDEGDSESDDDDDAVPDDSLEHAVHAQRRKRRRVGSAPSAHGDDGDAAPPRPVSLNPTALVEDSDDGPSPSKRARVSPSPPLSPSAHSHDDLAEPAPSSSTPVPRRAAALASHAFSTSTPSRLSNVLTAPAPSSPAATGLELPLSAQSLDGEDSEREEGELDSDDDDVAAQHSPASPALALASDGARAPGAAHPAVDGDGASTLLVGAGSAQVAVPVGGAAGQVQLALPDGGGEVTYSGLGPATELGGEGDGDGDGDRTVDMDMSFADLPAELLADLSRRAGGAISIPLATSQAPTKAAYGQRGGTGAKLDLSSTPVGAAPTDLVLHKKPPKLSYKPSPLAKPPVALVDPSSAGPAAEKAVYIRRQPVSTVVTDISDSASATAAHAKAAAAKAVYERPASAAGASAAGSYSSAAYKPRSKNAKAPKAPGQLPLTRDEKLERLPPKVYTAFGDFESVEVAADPAIWSVPHHAILPGRNLPPPNEACTHGFWPGPPTLKLGKAVFPAPPEPVDAADDLRPRVDVFIDNSNVLYSFLNWVRARPDVKVLNKALGGGGGAGGKGKAGEASKARQVKVVTIGGKKVCLDYRALFALIERGRKVERRILVGSSTLWQTLEPAVEWGYEVSLLQRVPRTEPSTSAATVAQVTQAPPPPPPQGKKRGKNGKVKNQKPQQQQPVIAQQQNSGVKHFKEQAVDELVHLKILETLLDHTPEPLPPPSPRLAAPAPQLPPAAAHPPTATTPAPSSTPAPLGTDAPVDADAAAPAVQRGSLGPSPPTASSSVDDSATATAIDSVAPAVPSPSAAPVTVGAVEAGDDVEMGGPDEEEDPQPALLPDDDALGADQVEQHVEGGPLQTTAGTSSAESSEKGAPPATSMIDLTASSPEPSVDGSASRPVAPTTALDPAASAESTEVPASASDGPPAEAPIVAPAKSRFLPSQAFLSGSVQPAKPVIVTPETVAAAAAAMPASRPPSGASKFTPAAPKPALAPRPPSRPAQGTTLTPVFAPRILEPRTRPTLVIVTGDANSSEYNPGGFLGCVRRALDRGWDVEVYAFTHGISSLWSGEQQIKVTRDGRRRGELRVVDLAQFGEELVL